MAERIGRTRAALYAMLSLPMTGETAGELGVASFVAPDHLAHADPIVAGFDDWLRKHLGDFTLAGGKQVMEAFIKTYGNKINVVYAHNDDMALGAIQAMEEAGMHPGKDVIVVSFDATKGGFQAMAAGKMNVDVECSPLLGPQLMSAVKDVVAGKSLPKRILTQETVFPMSVAAQTLPTRKY